ncbi:MAG: amidohydrolase family protein [Oscillospiraceae bacterium]|nr:amidohydrolase family protein [Oscillospiraceae bacterium]
MFIDIHSHCYRVLPFCNQYVPPFCTPEQLIRRYDKMKVDYAVLLPVINSEIYFVQSVEDVVEICQKHPDRFIPYCNVDPRAMTNSPTAPLDEVMRYYKSLGCKGIGEVMPNMELLDPKVQNLFACAAKENMPIVFDGSVQKDCDFGLYDDAGLPQLEYTLLQFPNLKIFGHGPVFWCEIAKLETPAERGVYFGINGQQGRLNSNPILEEGVVPKLFRRYENLCGDLSDGTCFNAMNRDHSYGPRFLSEFEDRLYFGTDMVAEDMFVGLDELLLSWRQQGKISETTFRKIAYDNAAKLLDIH